MRPQKNSSTETIDVDPPETQRLRNTLLQDIRRDIPAVVDESGHHERLMVPRDAAGKTASLTVTQVERPYSRP